MNLTKLASSLLMAGTSSLVAGGAHAVTVAGVTWDGNSLFDFGAQSIQFGTVVLKAGDILQGYGRFTALNADSGFCAGCELTYVFSGYTLNTSITGSPNTPFYLSGGSVKVYVDTSKDFNAANPASAANGQLWLDLVGADPLALGYTLSGSTTILNSRGIAGYGAGYMDVVGGLAQSYLDTNGEIGGSDFLFTTSFQPLSKPVVQGGVAYTHFGGAEISGVTVVPEAETYAMMLAGLGLVGLAARRRVTTNSTSAA
jgi:hypothetical protein